MSFLKLNNQIIVVIIGVFFGIGVELVCGLVGCGFLLMLVVWCCECFDELVDQLCQEYCVGVEVLLFDFVDM